MQLTKNQIDIHTHILPGVDDGSRDWTESRAMLKSAYNQGIRHLIATPHFSQHQQVEQLESLARQLRAEAKNISPELEVSLGQEVLYFEDLVSFLADGKVLTLAGSRCVLVEFYPQDSFARIMRAINQLQRSSYVPMIAHIERYQCLYEKGKIEELKQTGAYLQMNYGSLIGGLLDKRVRWCRRQVRRGYIDFFGSDMHNMTTRPPRIQEAVAWIKKQKK